jgi:hypothetical protein
LSVKFHEMAVPDYVDIYHFFVDGFQLIIKEKCRELMRKQIQILIVAGIVLFLSASVFGQNATRVKFGKGATWAIVTGSLNGFKSRKVFVIRVREGQTLNTEQIKSEASTRYITVSIESPSGADVTDMDASCNNLKEVTPTEAGDYKITVVECQKADAWRGSFKLKITVK